MIDYDRTELPRSGLHPLTRWLILLGLAFLAGLLTMGWVLTHWDAATPYLSWMRPPSQPARVAGPPLIVAPIKDPAAIERRVDELETRIERIAERAEAASGNADRAEGLLVAFAARRAIDRGLQLGYIEGLLRERFGQTQPAAVGTIITAAHEPVTIEELRGELEVLGPDIAGPGRNVSWWDGVRRELAAMVVVRRADRPSAAPADRLARAKQNLDAGQVDRALAEVARLPGREQAQGWMARARRYISAHNALDLIETSALLSPAHATAQRARQVEREDVANR